MKIAIVGAGVSGLVAAYLLSRRHSVEVFERNGYAGGHANTVQVQDELGADIALDVGFVVYAPRTYPGFTRLLNELGVETIPSEMSFSVRNDADGFEFSSRGLRGYLASPKNLLRPSHYRMLWDVARFQREARRVVAEDRLHDVTFGDYLEQAGYSDAFRFGLIVPLTAATWSNSPEDVLGFPANYLFRFLAQHGVLAPRSIPEWRSIVGGARSYVNRILATLPEGSFSRGSHVRGARRRASGGVRVSLEEGVERDFDAVVLACHPDQALELLDDPSSDERAALEGFKYAPNHVVLHTDEQFLPKRPYARAAWNYQTWCASGGAPATLTMTYDLNRLQSIPGSRHHLVSVNPGDRVAPESILAEFDYSHPVYSMRTLESQHALKAINGARDTHFAGAYLGYGFHEDGVQAGISVARALGGMVTARLRSHLLVGTVRHRRTRHTTYDFSHHVWYVAVALDELDDFRLWPLLAHDRRAVLELRDRDHMAMPDLGLRASVDEHLRRAGLDAASLRVTLITYPRILGFVFNPVSFYLCHDAGGVLRHVIAEVTNTHGGREVYDFAPAGRGPAFRATALKRMYVSPFIEASARYVLTVTATDRRLLIAITEFEAGGQTLYARIDVASGPLSVRTLLRALSCDPLVPLKTVALIAWHAARLRWRGLKWHRYRAPATPSTHAGAGRHH